MVTAVTAQRKYHFRPPRWCELFIEVLFQYRAAGHYALHAFVVMRDHVHILLTPTGALEKAVKLVKGGFSHEARVRLKNRESIWQPGFADDRAKSPEEYAAFQDYIHQNPVRARIVVSPEDFPYSSAYHGFHLDPAPDYLRFGPDDNSPRQTLYAFEDKPPGSLKAHECRASGAHEGEGGSFDGTTEVVPSQSKGLGILYIISAPSGSGKSTLVNELRSLVPNIEFSVSYTTRPPRGSEQNGREYCFVSRPEFERMLAEDQFLEHAEVFGNYYGTACRVFDDAKRSGKDLLLDIDVQGAKQVRSKIADAVTIFVMPPNRSTLERRLRNRGQVEKVDPKVIERRLENAQKEIVNYKEYGYILVNEILEKAVEELKAIVLSERVRRSGKAPTPDESKLLRVAERCLLANSHDKVRPVLDSF